MTITVHPVDTAAKHLTTAAATPNHRTRQAAFDTAWRLAEPTIRGIIMRILHDRDLADDAVQNTALKLWRSVTTGYQPETTWAQIVNTAARRAAIDTLDRHTRRDPERHEIPDHTPDTVDDYADLIDTLTDHTRATEARLHLNHLAILAERGYHQPLWARILQAEAAGHIGGAAIGRHLRIPEGTIRAHQHHMRTAGLYDGHPPTGWQLSLFDEPTTATHPSRGADGDCEAVPA